MGYAKYDEDNRLINEENINKNGIITTPQIIIKTFVCPYCDEVFDSQEKLLEHIRKTHSSIQMVISLNGKIVNDDISIYKCNNAIVKCFCDKNILYINGEKYIYNKNDEIDIKDTINELLSKNKNIKLSFANKKIVIHKLEKEDINKEIIKKIVILWNKEIKENLLLTNPLSVNYNLNKEEKELLNGIYDYYIGCKLKPIEEKDKINRYNDAISKLLKYIDISSIALFIIQTIALYYNWYEKFIQLKKYSSYDYYQIYNFIVGKENDAIVEDNDEDKDDDNYIYIDEEIEQIINLIKLYQEKGPGYINKIENYDETQLSINGKDTLCWLKARIYSNIDIMKSKEYYDEIICNCEIIEKEKLGGRYGK